MTNDNYDDALVIVGVDESDHELTNLLWAVTRKVKATGVPCWLLIGGYDDDERNLWAIPEVKDFANRLIRLGFLSLLHMCPPIEPETITSQRGWTAYELWLCGRGELGDPIDVPRMIQDIRTNRTVRTADDCSEFWWDVLMSNQRCDNLVSDSIN